MIKEEIINAIDDIYSEQECTKTYVMETMCQVYDKYNDIISNNPDGYYGFYNGNDSEIVQEGDGIVSSIKNVAKKIWAMIKDLFLMIKNSISSLINKIMHISKNGKKKKSVNLILWKILKSSIYNKPDKVESWPVPKIDPKYVKAENYSEGYYDDFDDEEMIQEAVGFKEEDITNIKGGPTRVKISAGPGSKIPSAMIDMVTSGVVTEFNDDNETISFHFTGISKLARVTAKSSSGGNISDDITSLKNSYAALPKLSVYMIKHDDLRKSLDSLIRLASDVVKYRKQDDIDELNSQVNKVNREMSKVVMTPSSNRVDITMKELADFQKWITDIVSELDVFSDTGTNVSDLDKKTIRSLNKCISMTSCLQMSLNCISSSLNNTNIIDAQFYESIKSVALLDKFVHECLTAGIPPKYIAYNTWLVANKCIRGNSDKYKLVSGQTRFILFPPNNKVVYKVAMSGRGVSANKSEVDYSKMFIDMGRVDLIAPILKAFENNAIVAMQKIKGDDQGNLECQKWAARANKAISDYEKQTGRHLNVEIGDQHAGNCKYDPDTKLVRSIDYGASKRVYRSK